MREKDKRIQLVDRKSRDLFIATMNIAGLAIKTEYDGDTPRGVHIYDRFGGNQAAAMPACCLNTSKTRYSRDWDDDVEFCDKCWEITIRRTDVILFPKRVTHFSEGRGDHGTCGHNPSPVTTVFTDEVTCPHCRMTDQWKNRSTVPASRYENFDFYYATELHGGTLPEGTLGDNAGHPTRRIFRTRNQLADIPAEYFKLVRDCEAINKARLELDCDPQAKENGWRYEPWNDGREILVEMSIQ